MLTSSSPRGISNSSSGYSNIKTRYSSRSSLPLRRTSIKMTMRSIMKPLTKPWIGSFKAIFYRALTTFRMPITNTLVGTEISKEGPLSKIKVCPLALPTTNRIRSRSSTTRTAGIILLIRIFTATVILQNQLGLSIWSTTAHQIERLIN